MDSKTGRGEAQVGQLEFRTRWTGSCWCFAVFLLVPFGAATVGVAVETARYVAYLMRHSGWPFGALPVPLSAVVGEDTSAFYMFALLGPAILIPIAYAMLRCRPLLLLDVQGLWVAQPLARRRLIPYSEIRTVEAGWQRKGEPRRFVIRATGASCWFTRALDGWPGLVVQLWRRCPRLQVDLPPRLRKRLVAVRDQAAPSPVLTPPTPADLRYPFGGPYATGIAGCVLGTAVMSGVAWRSDDGWGGLALFGPFAGGVVAVLVAIYLHSYARFRIRILPTGLQLRDRRGQVRSICWGDLACFNVSAPWPGGPRVVSIETYEGCHLVWGEIAGWSSLLRTLEAALTAIDRQVDSRQP